MKKPFAQASCGRCVPFSNEHRGGGEITSRMAFGPDDDVILASGIFTNSCRADFASVAGFSRTVHRCGTIAERLLILLQR